LLDRIDIVTGGASAVYGADAVAGVVNFVTKRNFNGVEATTLFSVSDHNDAKRYKNDLTIGADLAEGRGNVALHVGTTRTQALNLRDRDYASTALSSSTGNPGGFSGTSVPAVWGGMPSPINGSRVIDATTGLFRSAVTSGPPDGYNTNPPNYFETPLDRTQATALGRFSINEFAEVYAEIFHTRSSVTLNLAPSGTFGAGLNIPIGNPYIPTAIRQQLCGAYNISAANCVVGNATEFSAAISRRFVEAGPRIYNYDNTLTQYTTGLRGAIPKSDTWSYDLYFQSGRTDQLNTTGNGFASAKLQQAVRATSTTACADPSNGCVPINLFGAAGTITPAMLAFLSTPTFQTYQIVQQVISGSATGDVSFVKSPLAKDPLGLVLGIEQRTVEGASRSDAVSQTQGGVLGAGAAAPDRTGRLKFAETYVESSLPLIQDLPFIKALEFKGGFRQTHFTTSSGVSQNYNSYKGGFSWLPVKGFRIRAENQRATRAPNVNELYAPVTTGLSTLTGGDPCAGTIATAALSNLCQLTGVPASQLGSVPPPSSNQVNVTSGGNPNLSPERADTTTIGFVWDPEQIENLSLTVDYWKIKVKGAVSTPTATQVSSGCYSLAQNPTSSYNVFCQLIQRDRFSGGLNGTGSLGIVAGLSNLGYLEYGGVDLGATYRLPLKNLGAPTMGRVDLSLQYSYLSKADYKSLPSVDTLHQAGYYGSQTGVPRPKNKFSQRTTWNVGDYSVGYLWRYIGGTSVEEAGVGAYLAQYSTIPAVNYIDLTGTWQVTKNFKLSGTINNAFNKNPPLVGTGIGDGSNYGNTFPQVYDVIGRRFTVSATATF
jgi:outer membrane receptor protein involved in Fe transport